LSGPRYPLGGHGSDTVLNPVFRVAVSPTVNMGAGEQLPGVVTSQDSIAAGARMNPALTESPYFRYFSALTT
jgi:hypothetical protein